MVFIYKTTYTVLSIIDYFQDVKIFGKKIKSNKEKENSVVIILFKR